MQPIEKRVQLAESNGMIPTIDDMLNLPTLSDAQLSPNGRSVVYVVTTPDWEENHYVSQLWIVNLLNDARESDTVLDMKPPQPRQLTFHPQGSYMPRWSPDGSSLVFLSKREGDSSANRERSENKQQLYRMSISGGEPQRLTESTTQIEHFAWSPDGSSIAYVAQTPENREDKARQKHYGDYHVEDEDDRPSHLWHLDLTTGAARRLNHSDDLHVGAIVWAPHGGAIAFEGYPSPRVNDRRFGRIYHLDVARCQMRPLTGATAARPIWSPDGQQLAFLQASPSVSYKNANLTLLTLRASSAEEPVVLSEQTLGETFDEQIDPVLWREEGLYFTAIQRTEKHLFRIDPTTEHIERLSIDVPDGWFIKSASGSTHTEVTTIATIAASGERSDEVAVLSTSEMEPRETTGSGSKRASIYLTNYQATISDWDLGTNEVIAWQSEDGTTIEGVLTKPRDFDPSRQHPLLVVIHGGPAGTSVPALLGRVERRYYPIQQWVRQGALILQPNYRGSGGYGEEFRSLNVRNLGVGDAWDVLSGIDRLIAEGWIDPTRIGVMGWSQGGYISAFLATTSSRFQAISVGAGISNWITYYVNTDIHRFTEQYLEAVPWDDMDIYAKTSPITYIKQAQTPTLIQHGEFDHRVPLPNAYELYQGLQDVGVETKLVVYKGMGHGINRPRLNRQVMEENWAWFRRLWPTDERVEPDDPPVWQIRQSDIAYQNRWITVTIDDVELPTGEAYEYTLVNVNGVGVAVLGFNDAGEILLEREYRHGVGEVIWQLPGGLADEDEDWITAGLRELQEETGFAPDTIDNKRVRYLGSVWDNPGLGTGESHLVVAEGLSDTGRTKHDPAEFVTLHWRSLDWVKEAIRAGIIKERTTVAAIMHFLLEQEENSC